MCMARAIVVGNCYAEKEDPLAQKWNHIRRSNRQTAEAMKSLDQANIPHDKPCGIEDYKLIQAAMVPDYLIKVYKVPKDGLLFPLQFKKQLETKVIHIYWNGDHHSDTITKVTGFLGCSNDIPCTYERKIFCRDCKRTFRSPACFNNHKQIKTNQKKSICQLVYNCANCDNRIVCNKNNHVSPGQRKCKFCKTIVGPDRQCFIQSYQCKNNSSEDSEDEEDEEIKPEKSSRFIFFDFERPKKLVNII